MGNKKKTLAGQLLPGAILLLVVGGGVVLALWTLSVGGTKTVLAAGAKEEHHEDGRAATVHADHEETAHADPEHGRAEAEGGHVGPEESKDEDDIHDEQTHDEGGHEGHGEVHADHTEQEAGLRLTPEQRERFGIVSRSVGPGSLENEVSLPGEIVFNEDRLAHIVPRLSGIVREVAKRVGDKVAADEVLAVIDSRELAEAKAEFLAAGECLALAEANFAREEKLWKGKISAEKEYLDARQALAESRIALNSAEQKLHALGFSDTYLRDLSHHPDDSFTRYEIRAPFSGTIIEKHIALGEALESTADAFTIADTSSVWVNLTVYMKNLEAVRDGQDVLLKVDHSGVQVRGTVTMVTPFVEESTRSATARIVLDNRDGRWMPGTFVTGFIRTSEDDLAMVVPLNAVQSIEGRDVVFVEEEGSFAMHPVTVGRADRTKAEIVSGLDPGTLYVAEGAYQLKATAVTSSLGSHAGHGH